MNAAINIEESRRTNKCMLRSFICLCATDDGIKNLQGEVGGLLTGLRYVFTQLLYVYKHFS